MIITSIFYAVAVQCRDSEFNQKSQYLCYIINKMTNCCHDIVPKAFYFPRPISIETRTVNKCTHLMFTFLKIFKNSA